MFDYNDDNDDFSLNDAADDDDTHDDFSSYDDDEDDDYGFDGVDDDEDDGDTEGHDDDGGDHHDSTTLLESLKRCFLYDFTLFVIDMHQIRSISTLLTPFDHFQKRLFGGLIS